MRILKQDVAYRALFNPKLASPPDPMRILKHNVKGGDVLNRVFRAVRVRPIGFVDDQS